MVQCTLGMSIELYCDEFANPLAAVCEDIAVVVGVVVVDRGYVVADTSIWNLLLLLANYLRLLYL